VKVGLCFFSRHGYSIEGVKEPAEQIAALAVKLILCPGAGVALWYVFRPQLRFAAPP